MSPRPPIALLAFLCIAVLAAACSNENTDPPAADGATPAPDATAPPATDRSASPPVAQVLAFSAPRLGGGTVEGEDFAGRDVAFWFWAPW